MKTDSVKFTTIVCVAVVVVQIAFFFIPIGVVRMYNLAFRPIIYLMLASMIFIYMGRDARPVRKKFEANLIAALTVFLFGIIILVVSFLFGAGANVMTNNSSAVIRNLWEVGSIVILSEVIRIRLIKSADNINRNAIIIALTVALAFGHMHGIRMLIHSNVAFLTIFFESIFRPLVISAVASFFAFRGTFLSSIIISFLFVMSPLLVPIVPNILPIVWVLIICGLAFISAFILNIVVNDNRRALRLREKRALKYMKKPIRGYIVITSIILVIFAFFIGAFPVYPVVVLSNSMSGTFERGSIVLVTRVPYGRAFEMVGEGEIIHFSNRLGRPYVHRVVDFRFDESGERQYITQGDASDVIDAFPVAQEDVKGVVRAFMPFLGYPYIVVQAILDVFR